MFNTSSVVNGKRKSGVYFGKAEYFAVYSPDTGKIYMIVVDKAPRDHVYLRFKSVGVIRSNGKQSWHVPYEEAVSSGVNYWWAEDYEV